MVYEEIFSGLSGNAEVFSEDFRKKLGDAERAFSGADLPEKEKERLKRVYLVCQECGSIRRLERPELIKYLSGLKARLFSVRQPVLYLHGQCKKCTQALRRQASARTSKGDFGH